MLISYCTYLVQSNISQTLHNIDGINIFVKHQISTKVAARSKDESYRYSKLLSGGKKVLRSFT